MRRETELVATQSNSLVRVPLLSQRAARRARMRLDSERKNSPGPVTTTTGGQQEDGDASPHI
jgi:hypothetical protein